MRNGNLEMKSFNENIKQKSVVKYSCKIFLLLISALLLISCNEIKAPKNEPFIGENEPPLKQEFRWSNGKMPKSFDPARVSAAPETDIVRAIYEGLTDLDSKTLEPIPALALKWNHSKDNKTWTFHLRQDAKWTNGEPVIAKNFVDSWKRLTELGSSVPQRNLLKNIVGMDSEDVLPVFADEASKETTFDDFSGAVRLKLQSNTNSASNQNPAKVSAKQPEVKIDKENQNKSETKEKEALKFGVEAVDNFTLRVTLIHPDSEFPRLVSHPIFHPIFGDGKEFENKELNPEIVTNGAFRLISVAKDGITLERSQDFWGKDDVKLEKVKFVPTENAESALNAYRNGEIDAITNANFQPLALKLLQPFEKEFKRTTHGALNYYEFNLNEKPFNDLRVREALAISIERERLTQDEMDGVTEPALSFLPFNKNEEEKSDKKDERLKQDSEKAKQLLAEAGYPDGENFPTIKLVINRNNMQQKIARSVARMWEKSLNVKTEIIAKDFADFENIVQTGDYGLARRGAVLPTNNETSNMLLIFNRLNKNDNKKENKTEEKKTLENPILTDKTAESNIFIDDILIDKAIEDSNKIAKYTNESLNEHLILTEEQALEELPAIPLYFPTSYSLVKPYVRGFDMNPFDVLSLKNVQIDNSWYPSKDAANSPK